MARKSKDKKVKLITRGASDYIILIVVFLLLSIGLIMVLSASSPSSLSESGNSYKYFKRQAEAAAIGLVLMYIVSKVDYRIYKSFKWIIYIVSIAFLVLVGLIRNRSWWCKTLDYYCGIQFSTIRIC